METNPTHRCKHICKPLQAHPQTKVCKRASTSPTQEKLFFKISFPSKIFKTATAQPTHKDQNINWIMTEKPLSDLTFTTRTTITAGHNITYTQAGVSFFVGQKSGKFKVKFFVGSSVVIIPASV